MASKSTATSALEQEVAKLSKEVKELRTLCDVLKKSDMELVKLIAENTTRFRMLLDSTEDKKIEPVKEKKTPFRAKYYFAKFMEEDLYGLRETYFTEDRFILYFEEHKAQIKKLSTMDVNSLTAADRGLVYRSMADKLYSESNASTKTAISLKLQRHINDDKQSSTASKAAELFDEDDDADDGSVK